jgi:hypothetical protein
VYNGELNEKELPVNRAMAMVAKWMRKKRKPVKDQKKYNETTNLNQKLAS